MVIAFVNHKGGVGKTTTVLNTGTALALYHEKKILLVDIDPQANLTLHAGFFEEPEFSIYEVVEKRCTIEQAIQHREPFDILPSKLDLAACEISFAGRTMREQIIKKHLSAVKDRYDYILIDCPPSLGLLTINALFAADALFVPMQTEFLAVKGFQRIAEVVEEVQEGNENLRLSGVIATLYDKRQSGHNDVLKFCQTEFGDVLLNTVIRNNTTLMAASMEGQTIFEHDAKSRGAEDYQHLAEELLQRIQQ
ncbi:MAG: ParA family protein [Ignavibacteria bacterium]|nr:ParA family protein [Ignavibacteria bacterium]